MALRVCCMNTHQDYRFRHTATQETVFVGKTAMYPANYHNSEQLIIR